MSKVLIRPRTRADEVSPAPPVLTLAAPPAEDLGAPAGGLWQAVLPALGGAGALVWIAANPKPLNIVAGSMFAAASMAGAVGMAVSTRRQRYRQRDRQRARYLDHLADIGEQAVADADAQRAELEARHPDVEVLLGRALGRDVWQRSRLDDGLAVRWGRADQAARLTVASWDDPGPLTALDPVLVRAGRDLCRRLSTVADLPYAAALADHDLVHVRGDRRAAVALVSAVVGRLAVEYAPDDVRVAVLATADRLADWEWCKWLPHATHESLGDAIGAVRLIATNPASLAALLDDELVARRATAASALAAAHPRLVVVVDRPGPVRPDALGDRLGLGITVLAIGGETDDGGGDTDAGGVTVRVDGHGRAQWSPGAGAPATPFTADALDPVAADALARALAPLAIAPTAGVTGVTEPSGAPLAASTTLAELLGFAGDDDLAAAIARRWADRSPQDRLRVAFGVSDAGRPVELDLKEAALGGMGPHGLMIGATGSGKSEALRSLVLALALTHGPDVVTFVLVDFKGGAAFAELAGLPHVSGLVTNLVDDETLIDRVHDALQGELRRRQSVLKDAGNLASVHDYERQRAVTGAPPLPSLVVVVDEFAELLIARPDMVDLFNAIGRLGRSLGLHLLFSSQRLEEGRLRGLESHLSYRLALRTFSAAESRAVIGVDDAFHFSSAPGRGVLKVDTTVFERFRVSLASGPVRRRAADPVVAGARLVHPVVFSAGRTATGLVEPGAAPVAPAQPAPVGSFLTAALDAIRSLGVPQARAVWLPPLPDAVALDALVGRPAVVPGEGWRVPWTAPLSVPFGLADLPARQRQVVATHDFDGAGNNLLIVGAPRAGKSTLVRSLVLGSAVTHAPTAVQWYLVDLGAGGLDGLRGLPHVGAVAGRSEPELVARIVRDVAAVVSRRERAFTAAALDGIAAFRARRAEGALPDDHHGDVFLVIDNWVAFRTGFEELEPVVADLAGRGAGYGVHVVLTAGRPLDVRTSLRDVIGGRIELRLTDAADSEIDRRALGRVRGDQPGRGLLPGGTAVQVALPRFDGAVGATGADGTGAAVAAIAAAWTGPVAPPVHLLPALVVASELPPPRGRGVMIGVSELDLAPVELDLFDGDPHLVVFGDAESGKTTFLRTYLQGLVERYTPDEVRIVLVDQRRTLTDAVPAPYLAAYCGTPAAVADSLRRLAVTLAAREAPADVTVEQLRDRSWWQGPEIVVAVDDYELVASAAGQPLAPLAEWLPHARDLGVHVVVARRSGGAARAMFDPLLQQLRELCDQGLLLSGDPNEGELVSGVRPRPLPPGRAVLARRRHAPVVVQLARRDRRP